MNGFFDKNCTLCPRRCNALRTKNVGICGANDKISIAKVYKHHFEEPVISGTKGSGTVFFSNCNLKCVFCQNYAVSHDGFGKEISVKRLAEIFEEIEEGGAHNINLVTGAHYVPLICEAFELYRPKIPVVYNSSGYESVSALETIDKYVDVYLPDMKYGDNEIAKKYSGVDNYVEVALEAVGFMLEKKNELHYSDEGLLERGVIIRHLVLPSNTDNSVAVLELVAKLKKPFLISVMSQYTPMGRAKDFPEINRRLTKLEYKRVLAAAERLGLDEGFMQELSSAKEEYTPDFDLTGVEKPR